MSPKLERINLPGHITILVSGDYVKLEIEDGLSGCRLIDMTIDPVDFCKLLGRQAHVPCNMIVSDPSIIGKYEAILNIEFPLGEQVGYETDTKMASVAVKVLPEVTEDGWYPTTYFGSQRSFFYKYVDGESVKFARTHLTKWVELEEAIELSRLENCRVPSLGKMVV